MRIVAKNEWTEIENGVLPKHVGFIMDGNGRWAEGHGDTRINGHRAASKATAYAIEACRNLGIQWITFFAFSTENWKRSAEEVNYLMRFEEWLWPENVIKQIRTANTEVHLLGDLDDPRLSQLQKAPLAPFTKCTDDELQTSRFHVGFALNYGGRAELIRAIEKIKGDNVETVSEPTVQASLYCPNAPDLDLVIRTGGDERVSNFMLWEVAYAELLFIDTLWPDFSAAHMYSAVKVYQSRQRRYGGGVTNSNCEGRP